MSHNKSSGESNRRARQKATREAWVKRQNELGRGLTDEEKQEIREQVAGAAPVLSVPVEWEPCPLQDDHGWRVLVVSLVLASGRWSTSDAATGRASQLADDLRQRTAGSGLIWRPGEREITDEGWWQGFARSRATVDERHKTQELAHQASERLAVQLYLVHGERRRVWPAIESW